MGKVTEMAKGQRFSVTGQWCRGGRRHVGARVIGDPPIYWEAPSQERNKGCRNLHQEGRVVAPGLTVSPRGKEGAAEAEGQMQGPRGRATAEHGLGHGPQKTHSRSRVPSPASPGAGTGVSSAELSASPPR